MHNYSDLLSRATIFALNTLELANERTVFSLQTSGATDLVKTLQMIQLQKAMLVVGMFSMFEAKLQDELNCVNGFSSAKNILLRHNETKLYDKFIDLELVINVLKHGKGRSYNNLLLKGGGTLRSYIKELNVNNHSEGDVSEISTLIQVDFNFVEYCSSIINDVSRVMRQFDPKVNL